VVAGLIPVGHAVVRSLPPPSLPARQGPLDRFRTAGSWLLAAAVCAFNYAFGDDSSNALPGIHKSSSLLLWCGVNVVGLLAFSALCTQEARHSVRESWVLRLYWLLMVGSWGAAVVVRSDALASDGLAQHPTNPASLCFYGLAAAVLALGAAYGLFNAQVLQNIDNAKKLGLKARSISMNFVVPRPNSHWNSWLQKGLDRITFNGVRCSVCVCACSFVILLRSASPKSAFSPHCDFRLDRHRATIGP